MNDIGNIFRVTRESSGVSIAEVSADLDIKEVVIENIEDGKIGAFKDVFLLKNYIYEYAKYLGLDSEKMIDSFNEFLFEYTSRIPVKDIQKAMQEQIKEDNFQEKVVSPYTKLPKKHTKKFYMTIYIIVSLVCISLFVWSIRQITVNQSVSTTISNIE